MGLPQVSSPRSSLRRLIESVPNLDLAAGDESKAVETLRDADATNKLRHRKLYLVLDLDETLVYTQRLAPDASPVGSIIYVRGQPFDVVLRPGLKQFLQVAAESYVIFLYTMGDEEYTRAVLAIIDPENKLFDGGVCWWRTSESRLHKSLERTLVDRRMALVIDDTVDVWADDLQNLCLSRRFVGDPSDDGLMLLAFQLRSVHSAFYATAPPSGFSLEADAPLSLQPPDVRQLLATMRGDVLAGCSVALTGVVADQSEEALGTQPLCQLVRHYGASLTMSVDDASHLVARKKDGWKKSSKIARVLSRTPAEDAIFAVWDHWLLDSLVTWERQPEATYAIPPLDGSDGSDRSTTCTPPPNAQADDEAALDARVSHILGLGMAPQKARHPPSEPDTTERKRMRVAEDTGFLGANKVVQASVGVAATDIRQGGGGEAEGEQDLSARAEHDPFAVGEDE